jgi:hypothetical protein
VGENTSQIEHEIRAEREELGRNLEDLEEKARQLADWRVHYRRHPEVFLGVAFGAGLLLAALAGEGRADSEEPAEPRYVSPRVPLRERSRKAAQVAETWGHISDAFLGLATAKAVDYIADHLPGFRDHYDRQSGGSARDIAV